MYGIEYGAGALVESGEFQVYSEDPTPVMLRLIGRS
jgi:hypothetical protein